MPGTCSRCGQRQPAASHDEQCAARHWQVADVEQAAATATALTPTRPVTPAQAADLLAHLATPRPGRAPIPDPVHVVELVLALGWRPIQP